MKNKPIILGITLLLLLSSITPIASMKLNDGWNYDESTGTWSIEFSGETNESFILKYGFIDISGVGVIYSTEYSFPNGSKGYIETSYNQGDTWDVIREFNQSSVSVRDLFLTLTSGSLWVRFTIECNSGSGFWRIWDIDIIGDTRGKPPHSSVTFTSIMVYWVPNVFVNIYSYDKNNGVKEIHYLLYGEENIVSGSRASFNVNKEGVHYLTLWAVDNAGNEEIPQFISYPIPIDSTPPYIKIISPESGVYIFGNKLPLNINKTIIIGGFDIEVEAYDETSGLYHILFELRSDEYYLFNMATEEPYIRYCGIKNNGIAKLRVVAADFASNTAEDSLEIYYYNFF